jgi:phage anti-repressor protein
MSLDIVGLISNNPITKLSKPYQNKLLNKIKSHFTTDEQHMFVTSFYCYLNYSDDEFVIDFDTVWEWMGYFDKKTAKRTLTKHFTQDVEYTISLGQNAERSVPKGGENKETIMITLNTFKDMCMRANTKKAKEIRTYFIKLEKILMELVNEEASELRLQLEHNENLLEQKNTLLQSTETALQAEQKKFADYTRRRYINEPPGERVYALQGDEHDPNSDTKIGTTDSLRDREGNHNTSNAKSKVVYAKACHNGKLLEKVAHHMLAKHRTHKFREWFQVKTETAKEIINIAQLLLDEVIPISELLAKHKVYDQFKEIIDAVKDDPVCEPEPEPTPEPEYKNKYDIQNEAIAKIEETIQQNISNAEIPPLTIKIPQDFDRFIAEQCEVDPVFQCLNAELYGAHKIWCGNQSISVKSALVKYMAAKFTSKKIFYPEHNATLATFVGVRPKPFTIPPPTDEITTFIHERCKLGYTYRCNYITIYEEFEKWKKESLVHYSIDKSTKKKIQALLHEHFFSTNVYLNVAKLPDMMHNNSHGVWGITLKSDNSHTGIKLSHKLKKRIVSIDIHTNQVVDTFDSLVSAAKHHNVSASYISTDIKFGRIRQNRVFRFIKDDGTILVSTKKRRSDSDSDNDSNSDT